MRGPTAFLVLLIAACGGEPVPAEVDAAFVCDFLDQDCPDGDKCSFIQADGVFEPACTPVTGGLAEGEACTRDPDLGFGHDDCAAGLFCTFIGMPVGMRHCRELCYETADCPTDQRCAQQLDGPPAGFCGPTCEPFSPCADGMTCGDLYNDTSGAFDAFLTCRDVGAVAIGGSCEGGIDCGADAVCFSGTCVALCDDSHPCSAGSCQTVAGIGFCG